MELALIFMMWASLMILLTMVLLKDRPLRKPKTTVPEQQREKERELAEHFDGLMSYDTSTAYTRRKV
jgi:hypothetical protein